MAPPKDIPSLKLTAFSHLKMGGWNTIVSFLGWPIFRGKLLVLGSVDSEELLFAGWVDVVELHC